MREVYQVLLSKIYVFQYRKMSLEKLLGFQKDSGVEKKTWIGGRGVGEERVSRSFVEIFISHSIEKFLGQPFGVTKFFGFEKLLCLRRQIRIFCRKFLFSRYRKILRRTFVVSETFCYRKSFYG